MGASKMTPINQFFILVMSLTFFFFIFKRIPLFDEFLNITYTKWLKAIVGLVFAIGGIFIYFKSKNK